MLLTVIQNDSIMSSANHLDKVCISPKFEEKERKKKAQSVKEIWNEQDITV